MGRGRTNDFGLFWGIFGITFLTYGKSGGATFRKIRGKNDFLLFLLCELNFGHMAKVGVRHLGRDRQNAFFLLYPAGFPASSASLDRSMPNSRPS